MDLEQRKQKYTGSGLNGVRMREERTNFLFLSDGSMIYDYDRFNSAEDALVDAVVSGGEDMDEMISLVFSQTNSSLRPMLTEEINKRKHQSPTAEAKGLAAWFPGNGLTESGEQPE